MARLIFLTGTPPTTAGGSGTWVGISVLRQAILNLGHDVTLIAPSPRAGGGTTLSRIVFNVRARSLLRGMQADVLVGFDLDGVFAEHSIPHVAAIKGVLADEAGYEHGSSRLALAVQARLERMHVRRADRVITTSAYSAGRIARLYGASGVLVVPELIDLDTWHRSMAQAPLAAGPPRILCVAHLYSRKSVDTLLRAFARVERDAVLRVVGVGPERRRLEALARDLAPPDRIHFLGHLPFHELTAEYRNASVFALPTAQEGFGIVFLEAMASSLPIVAGRAAAVPDVVGEAGALVDPHDDAALAETLRMLLDNPAMRQAMGAAGRERVRRYAAPAVARQFLEAIGIGTNCPSPRVSGERWPKAG